MRRLIITTLLSCLYLTSLQAKVIDIKHWTTPNGVRVYFVQASHLPMVDIKLLFKAGAAYDEKLFGLAALTNELLDQGTQSLSANQIAESLENNGAILSSNTQKDYATVSLRTLTASKAMASSLKTLKAIISAPAFNTDAITREKAQIITAIKHSNETPQALAAKTFYQALYGKHPYAHPVIGNETSIKKITPADIGQFYHKHYAANHAVLTIVGDLNKQQAEKLAINLTNKLPHESAPLSIPNAKYQTNHSQSIKYASNQSIIRIGQLGLNYKNKHYFPLIVGNYTLGGGGLVSQLAEEIREKRGLSYGVGSYFLPLEGTGPFIVSLATKTAQTKQALNVTKHTINRFLSTGPTAKELNAAKAYMIGSFPLRLSSNQQIAGLVSLIGFYHLPLDYLDNYTNRVKKVTAAQIKQSFNELIKPNNLLTIIVGK